MKGTGLGILPLHPLHHSKGEVPPLGKRLYNRFAASIFLPWGVLFLLGWLGGLNVDLAIQCNGHKQRTGLSGPELHALSTTFISALTPTPHHNVSPELKLLPTQLTPSFADLPPATRPGSASGVRASPRVMSHDLDGNIMVLESAFLVNKGTLTLVLTLILILHIMLNKAGS